jgi:hypothetical protein
MTEVWFAPCIFQPRSRDKLNKSQGTERENKMKNILTNLMTSAVLVFALGSGLEAQTIRLHAAVPFAFQANGVQLNAGNYSITRDASAHVVRIQETEGAKGVYLLTRPLSSTKTPSQMVFHRYGNRYFLAAVVAPGMSVSDMKISRAEREAMQSESPREVSTVTVEFSPVGN